MFQLCVWMNEAFDVFEMARVAVVVTEFMFRSLLLILVQLGRKHELVVAPFVLLDSVDTCCDTRHAIEMIECCVHQMLALLRAADP